MTLRLASALAAGLLATAILASPSARAQPGIARAERVSYADLDLLSEAGRATLDRRIKAAAGRICNAQANPDLRDRQAARACRTAALADASAQLQSALAVARSERQLAAAHGAAGR